MADYNVHLIHPVDAGPVLTLDELEQEKWLNQANQLLVMPLETQHAVEQLTQLIDEAESTLADMETYLREKQREHILEVHSH